MFCSQSLIDSGEMQASTAESSINSLVLEVKQLQTLFSANTTSINCS